MFCDKVLNFLRIQSISKVLNQQLITLSVEPKI